MQLIIRAHGRPAPQGSKESGGAGQLRESSIYLPSWRQAVKIAAWRACKDAGYLPAELPLFPRGSRVVVELMHFYVLPEQCRAEGTDDPLGDPDLDKLMRAVLDALGGANKRASSSARLYADDSQVMGCRSLWKYRATPEQPAGAVIIISDGRD